ncbi:type II secretion system protein N [Roseovarius litorisediminis]|nr:type II secretion system protein N [Roseovarius litorisediminis]
MAVFRLADMAWRSGSMTFLAAIALGYGTGQLALTLTASDLRRVAPIVLEQGNSAAGDSDLPDDARGWPPIFGVFTPNQTVTAAAPKPSENYELLGLMAGGDQAWAMVTSSQGNALVSVGDTLPGGEVVRGIDAEGVWIEKDGAKEVVGFEETPAETYSRLVSSDPLKPKTAEVPISAFSGRDMRRVLGRAGSVRMVAPRGGNGDKFPEILWVREGQLYDLIGLRRGDLVLRVNGYSVGDLDTLENASTILSSADKFVVEILRGGQRQTINVKVSGRG